MGRRVLTATTFIWAMIALSQLSLAQVIVNGTVTYPTVSGNTVLLGNGPTTPIMTYAAPGPTAGISDAGRAGISNSAPLPSTLAVGNDTVVYYTQPGVQPTIVLPGAIEGVPPVAVMPAAATEAAPPENTAGASSAAGGAVEKAFADFGPSSFGGTMSGGIITSANGTAPAPGANDMSLAQIAAQYKAAKAGLNARTLTNQDVDQMLGSKAGVTVAKNMPPLGPSAMPSGLTQGGAPQSTAPAAGQQPVTPPAAETTQAQPAAPAATAGAGTTPQVNPRQQSNDAQGKSKLPSTATLLPLLGLLGLVSGGIGLLVRKFRR
jgi:hypothetical protein